MKTLESSSMFDHFFEVLRIRKMYSIRLLAVITVIIATNRRSEATGKGGEPARDEDNVEGTRADAHDTKLTEEYSPVHPGFKVSDQDKRNKVIAQMSSGIAECGEIIFTKYSWPWGKLLVKGRSKICFVFPTDSLGELPPIPEESTASSHTVVDEDIEKNRKRDTPDSEAKSPEIVDKSDSAEKSKEMVKKWVKIRGRITIRVKIQKRYCRFSVSGVKRMKHKTLANLMKRLTSLMIRTIRTTRRKQKRMQRSKTRKWMKMMYLNPRKEWRRRRQMKNDWNEEK